MNERITENILRDNWRKSALKMGLSWEEQKSQNPKIQKLLKNASKNGSGFGYPDFIISGFHLQMKNF